MPGKFGAVLLLVENPTAMFPSWSCAAEPIQRLTVVSGS